MHCQHNHQNEECNHQVLCNAFQAALKVKAQYNKAEYNCYRKINHVDCRVRNHSDKTEVRALSRQEHHEIVHHPACDNGIKRHQCYVAEECNISVDMPLLPLLFQLLVHFYWAGLGSSTHGKFHDHSRQAQQDQAKHINKHKSATAVLAGHPGELPYVAAADSTSCAQQDKSQTAAEFFTSVIHKHPPIFSDMRIL